ncbi:hypothetical protein OH491_13665 [Termitidicoccus mucosus]|uniref:DUF3102 domain-containing protein n=1 Tax=Termitidicoccus mucosus TaxID=1184151 RepID=A0A178IJ64_9BACT|nr:hypothetical protein AW736_13785 [Opitutaceae bacterium TSB47]
MNTKSKTSNALVLTEAPEWKITGAEALEGLKRAAVDQLAAVGQMENKAAMGGTLAGLTLLRVKASMERGRFDGWLAEKEKSTTGGRIKPSRSTAYNYMKLATVFLEKAKVTKPDLLTLPGDQLTLSEISAEGDARELFLKLQKFTGGHSLNELLIKHDIKSGGLKKELAKPAPDDEPAPPPTPEEMFEMARDEIGGALERIEHLLIKENRLQHLFDHPDELRGVMESLRLLTEKVEMILEPLLGVKPKAAKRGK